VISIRLPWLSRQLGAPVVAMMRPPYGTPTPELHARAAAAPAVAPESLLLLVRSVPATVLVACPPAVPGAECYEALDATGKHLALVEWELWVDSFLSACLCLHSPRCPARPGGGCGTLDPGTGRVRHRQSRMRPEDVDVLGADRDPLAVEILRVWNWIPRPDGSLPWMPSAAMQDILRRMSRTLKLPAHEILRWSIPDFCLNYRLIVPPRQSALGDLDDGAVPEEMLERA